MNQRSGKSPVPAVGSDSDDKRQASSRVESLDGGLLRDCGWGVAAVAAVTAVSWFLQRLTGYEAIALVYLLAVVLLALVLNRWAVLLVAMLSALLWNFLFIQPLYTFRINSVQDAMM